LLAKREKTWRAANDLKLETAKETSMNPSWKSHS